MLQLQDILGQSAWGLFCAAFGAVADHDLGILPLKVPSAVHLPACQFFSEQLADVLSREKKYS